MASGSADETIHVYDMKARKESGLLVHHNGKGKMSYRYLPKQYTKTEGVTIGEIAVIKGVALCCAFSIARQLL
jgi:hypothetical protein